MDKKKLKNLTASALSYTKDIALSSVIIIYTGIFLVLLGVVQTLYLNNKQINIPYSTIAVFFGGKIAIKIVSQDILQFFGFASLILGAIISLLKRIELLTSDHKKLRLHKWFIILIPLIMYGLMALMITTTSKQIYGLEMSNFLTAAGIIALMATFSGIIYLIIVKFIDFLIEKFFSY